MKRARARPAARSGHHETFAALSDPVRLAVVERLRERPHRAGELAEALAMTAPALSRHLKVLRKSGLIVDDAVEEDARVRLYRLRPEAFANLRDWLSEVQSFWEDQLASLQAHAQATTTDKQRR
ncbi:MAG: winged helix-turn-helix transcriptional regulator [Proteobacteria bacterium]|nr:winged helix-turn-helix transcriptional regulator [Pseudomonadota bacterium]